MRHILLLLLTFAVYNNCISQTELGLIPLPLKVKQMDGNFFLKNPSTVANNLPTSNRTKLFNYFKSEMKKQFGITVVEVTKGKVADINFGIKKMLVENSKPAYKLSISKTGVLISGNADEAVFNAFQTFFQLIEPEKKSKIELPFVQIFDYPRFEYRGMHLDVARHFYSVIFVKKYIDYLAYHKINKFHWHLTEDQGWRVEIDKYPLLTKNSAYRNGTIIGHHPGKDNDNKPYGGFYTKQQIKDVVKYASDRFIEVIPEIEMPGHSSAAIAAYPWLSCFPGNPTSILPSKMSDKSAEDQKNGKIKFVPEAWGVFDDIFCAGNDSVFTFLEDVLDEVIPLFPSKYFHIGGDEAPKKHWEKCERCKKRLEENKLKDNHELQSYFIQRMEKYLNNKGKILIGWDEILEGGLAKNAIVMSWRGEEGGIAAAKQKHKVIMTPGKPVYFDHSQNKNEDSLTIGGYNPIEKVYAYEPVPKELTSEEAKYILGAQANMWTEYVPNFKKLEYMIFPRMAALCETLWSKKENKNWNNFEKRLPKQLQRYERWGASYNKAKQPTE